jgi:dTDP-4-amino-4,6-dideoxygalactose transaminase
LAICTGKPRFPEPLHVGRPNIGSEDALIERIRGVLKRRWFTNDGQLVQEFERKLERFLGVRHCVAICNATVALEIAIRALELNGEVIVPSFTFIAAVHALQWHNVTPVFCDVGPDSHNLDPGLIEGLITPRTTGILGVHVWGNACDTERLAAIAETFNLRLLYDAAHAFGCSVAGRMIGSFGDCEIFSFHAAKFFNTFEGGVIATNNSDLDRKLRLMRNFGFSGIDTVSHLGTNGKMNEISAAMGLTGLESLAAFIESNQRNYQQYRKRLKDVPGIRMFLFDEHERNNYQYIVLEIDEVVTRLHRNDLVRILEAEQVLARRYFYPGCHRMEPYKSLSPQAGLRLSRTEALTERVLVLPTGTSIGVEDVDAVCDIIQTALRFPEECKRALRSKASTGARPSRCGV